MGTGKLSQGMGYPTASRMQSVSPFHSSRENEMSRASEIFSEEIEEATVESHGRTVEDSAAFAEGLPAGTMQYPVKSGRNSVRRGKGEEKAAGSPTKGAMRRRGSEGVTRRAVGLNMIAGLAGFQGSHRPTGKLGRFVTPAALVPPQAIGGWRWGDENTSGIKRVGRQLQLGIANDQSATLEFAIDTVEFQTSCEQLAHWNWNRGSCTLSGSNLIFSGTGVYTETYNCTPALNTSRSLSDVWTFSNLQIGGTQSQPTLLVNPPSAWNLGIPRITLSKIGSEPVVWSPWEKLNDGYAVYGVGACATGPNQFHIFTCSSDHQVYQMVGDGYNWSGFSPLGAYAISAPAALSFGTDIFVFVVGGDQALYYLNWNGASWNGWFKLGGECHFGVAVCSSGPNKIDVFTVGSDLALYRLAWNGSAWLNWESLGGRCASVPGAVSLSSNIIDVYVLGEDGATYQDGFNGSNWSDWSNLAGGGSYGVSACSSASNRIDLVTVGASDRTLYYKYWDGSRWNGWIKENGVCASAPVIVSGAQNTGDVFVLGDDHAVYHKSFR
jgi:hypothetical protein